MDVEWKIKSEKKSWPPFWKTIDVYPDEIIITIQKTHDIEKITIDSFRYLSKILGDSIDTQNKSISLQLSNKKINIVLEEMDDESILDKSFLPLFKDSFYEENYKSELSSNKHDVPVVAFHSYKGGVGRTLSMIALLLELSRDKNFKALVIDADIEAPGLTLMSGNYGFPSENRISYADILSIIHDSSTDCLFSDIVQHIAKLMVNSTITIPGTNVNIEHFFLPAYRYDYQLLDNFVHPETIVSLPDRSFVIQDFFSCLGKELKVNAVLVDLRAGFSELSAPFLFDQRIKRVFVTTTSKQSIDGTKKIIKRVINSSSNQKNEEISNISFLLNMIPKGFNEDETNEIIFDILNEMAEKKSADEKQVENDKLLSDIVIQANFSDNLVHIDDLNSINESLKETSLLQTSSILAKRLVLNKKKADEITEEERKKLFETVYEITKTEISAEGRSKVEIMATLTLDKLCRAYKDNIPKLVILGAKGSGKTYLYKQLLDNKYWEVFVNKILPQETHVNKTVIIPVLATKNRVAMNQLFENCFSTIEKELDIKINIGILNKNERYLQKANENQSMKNTEWFEVWNNMLLDSVSIKDSSDFSILDNKLSSIRKRIVFIFDGLEDVFNDTIESKNSQTAIKYLCQDIVNKISEYKNIGIIVFIRNDIIQNSLQTNYPQFENQYSDYSIKWSQEEALRLTVWILTKIGFYNKKQIIDEKDIPKLSGETLGDYLVPFWGKKLGWDGSNEAFSTNWIIAALSDLKSQIQARDIIRFLFHATSNYSPDLYYHNRILLPAEIKKAIPPCSKSKLEEIYSEMANLKMIFDKIIKSNIEKKLPIKTEILTSFLDEKERLQLEAQGYLILIENSYYFPEIIRHALGFEYASGARPKVLSLLKKNKFI